MENKSVTDIRQAGVLLPPWLFYLYFVVFSKYTPRERGIALFLLRAFYLKRHSLRERSVAAKSYGPFYQGRSKKIGAEREGGEWERP